MNWKLLASMIMFFSCFVTQAQKGNQLLRECETNADGSQGFCFGYISGFAAGYSWVEATANSCQLWQRPPDVDSDQLVRVVTKWLQDNPQRLHEHADILMMDTFIEYFSCPKE